MQKRGSTSGLRRRLGGATSAVRADASMSAAGGAVFSLGLGIATIAVPLLAVRTGYSPTAIGVLVALSAVSQMITRVFMGAMMRRLPDKVFIVAAAVLLALSSVLLVLSAAWLAFAVSQLLQGVSRAFFWTGTQTHAVRGSSSAVAALARVNLASGVGQVAGPLLGGVLADRSLEFALMSSAVVSALAAVPALLLLRLPPFARLSSTPKMGPLWRRPGVDVGCWAGATAGAWRGLLNSYVPVVLQQAGQSPSTIGLLISVANAASVVGSGLAGQVRGAWRRRSLVLGVVTTGLGTATVGPLAATAVGAGLVLAVSGVGGGALQTVGPAVATDSVDVEERGQAIAASGTFRAAALFLAPFGVAGMVAVLPLSSALVAAGMLMTVPSVTVRRLGRGGPEAG